MANTILVTTIKVALIVSSPRTNFLVKASIDLSYLATRVVYFRTNYSLRERLLIGLLIPGRCLILKL